MKRIVEVSINDRKRVFLCEIKDIALDDTVVVDTQNGLRIGKVIGLDAEIPLGCEQCMKYVVTVVNEKEYRDQREAEEQRQKKLKDLERQMDEQMNLNAKIKAYQEAAKDDPALNELFERYKALIKDTAICYGNAEGNVVAKNALPGNVIE